MRENILRTISSLLSYIGCICVALLIMYYLNGTIGIFIATALICAFILSLVLTLIAAKSLSVSISTDTELIAKGESINCTVKFTNRFYLPVPIAEIEIGSTPHLSQGEISVYKCALAGKSSNTIKIPLKAVHGGMAKISVKRAAISDFLGILTFPLSIPEEEMTFKAAIYPNIPDVPVQTDFLKTTNRFTSTDDEEEESNETSAIPTGMPGYDHREYVPGDPIKRINWKLSSKRDIYMIRLDEQIHGSGQLFFLNAPEYEETELTLSVRDIITECALSILGMLVREGRDAVFYLYTDKTWTANEIHEAGDILALQELLAHFSPSKPRELVPAEIIQSGKTPICLTSAIKEDFSEVSAIASQFPEALILSAQKAELHFPGVAHWTVSDEFELTKSSEN